MLKKRISYRVLSVLQFYDKCRNIGTYKFSLDTVITSLICDLMF